MAFRGAPEKLRGIDPDRAFTNEGRKLQNEQTNSPASLSVTSLRPSFRMIGGSMGSVQGMRIMGLRQPVLERP
jgi:hypothetical protein